ncbi:MAG: hypothetical protein KF830_04990 [Planctomycetes bacterium]|nr:hypothetical protein [Planctomycetota bacterium]
MARPAATIRYARMFDRFIRLAKASKALREQRLELALALAADPLIRDDRRAGEVRAAAAGALEERARRHLAAGDLAAARADARCLAAAAPGPEAERLGQSIDAAAAVAAAAVDLAHRTLVDARGRLEAGDTAAARALLATIDPKLPLLERRQVEQLLHERLRQAEQLGHEAERALAGGDVEMALCAVERAVALDRDAAPVAALLARVAAALARTTDEAVAARLAAADVAGALATLASAWSRLPAAVRPSALADARRRVLEAAEAALRRAGSLAEAGELAAAFQAAGLAEEPRCGELVAAVVAAGATPAGGVPTAAAERLAAAAARFGAEGLVRVARDLAAVGVVDERRVAAARQRLERGELTAARLELLGVLADQPGHEGARRELALVEQGLVDLAERLATVRTAAQAGRLAEACSLGLALVGCDGVGAEAQQIVADTRARMELVERGLGEVRVALHGRLAAGIEGVRHCLGRLQELAKLQTDHPELPALERAVQAEIEALGHCEAAAAAIARQAWDAVATAIDALPRLRERLLSADRIGARIAELGDRLLGAGEQALALGQLVAAGRCADLFAGLVAVPPAHAVRAEALRSAVAQRRDAATQLVEAARACLRQRNLDEAERLAAAAAAQWLDGPDVQRLGAELAALHAQGAVLAQVEQMTRDRDFFGAQRKLAALPPTQAMMRTRIFDMKQSLARAQGLEGAFLLRVDEGGEHLVLRGETITIGNVRQRRADLPVLANLAGRHASVRRSMSFHGGMQDTLVAEEGPAQVAGQPVGSRVLAAGDRVRLGPAFAFVYQRPSDRSLSALLVLQSGFQVAGTDRVLLMKDRGRDGRLLLGSGRDVHVRVPSARGEVELYATNGGQMRVYCETGGAIDGVDFRGEHPVAAGEVVEAAGITFVLTPWHPGT